jgi:hypothetical protein
MIFVSSHAGQSETGNFFGDNTLSFRIPLLTTHRIPTARPRRGVSPAHEGEAEKTGQPDTAAFVKAYRTPADTDYAALRL